MGLKLYNTITRNKDVFKPLQDGEVKMYLCGPTVYDFLHIGNFRGAITFNFFRNWLEEIGYKVTYVYNYTDVDDKIIKKAQAEGVDSLVISERFISEFEKDFKTLGLKPHDHNPKVTESIPEIINVIEKIIKNGHGYVVSGEVFYDIDSIEKYGELSKKKLDDLEAGQRVEVDQKKKNPFDFVLWKPSKEGEPAWDSPWGKGRPGWHIECTAMIQNILGDTIDIHAGGVDLVFPHHENEIAQGEAATGCKYCNYWMHNNFINMNDEKMSKSLGNVITARKFMEMYHPEILKFLFISSHYRSLLNLNEEKITQVISGLDRVYSALEVADRHINANTPAEPESGFKKKLEALEPKIKKVLNDDFNTADFIAQIFEAVREFNSLGYNRKGPKPISASNSKFFRDWLAKYAEMSALFKEEPESMLARFDDILLEKKGVERTEVESLIAERAKAREAKDFAKSDEIRDKLSALGVELRDGLTGRAWTVEKSL